MHPEREITMRDKASASDRRQDKSLARENWKLRCLDEEWKEYQIDHERREIDKPEAREVFPPAAANVEYEPTLCHESFQDAQHVRNDQIQ
jgi:hypothetical protein